METSEEILGRALALPADSWERWDCIEELHKRGDAATFRAAAALIDSVNADRRAVGVDVLAQLGANQGVPVGERPFTGEATRLLLDHVPQERDPEVLASIAVAFGHLHDPTSIPVLRGLATNSDERVRYGVVHGLTGFDDDVAVKTLIELSEDHASDIRDWATFGLGTQIERDDPDVRAALVARLDDSDDDTRAEALRGLATRGDLRAIPRLLRELQSLGAREDTAAIEEAVLALAAKTGDERLCGHVRAIHDEWQREGRGEAPWPDLQAAIEACSRNRPDPSTERP